MEYNFELSLVNLSFIKKPDTGKLSEKRKALHTLNVIFENIMKINK